jgi:hypothetical protein
VGNVIVIWPIVLLPKCGCESELSRMCIKNIDPGPHLDLLCWNSYRNGSRNLYFELHRDPYVTFPALIYGS